MGVHDIGHVCPPATHDGELRQVIDGVALGQLHHREQGVAIAVQKDPVVNHPGVAQRLAQLRSQRIVATAVLLMLAGEQVHAKGFQFHGASLTSPSTPLLNGYRDG